MKAALTWGPRAIVLFYAGLLALFATDAFSGGHSFGQQVLGFAIHLLPALFVLAILVVAWRFPLIGGVGFMVLGMVFTIYFHAARETSAFLLISTPLFLSGILFILSHWYLPKPAG